MSVNLDFKSNIRLLHGGSGDNDKDQTANKVIQSISIVFFLSISLIFGLIPLFVKSCKGNIKLTGIANAFSCGLFIAVAVIHILPEVNEEFTEYFEEHYPRLKEIPWSYMIAFLAYSLILFVEKVAFDSHALIEHDHGDEDEDESLSKTKQELDTFQNTCEYTVNSRNDDEQEFKNIISTTGKIGSFLNKNNKNIINTDNSYFRNTFHQKRASIISSSVSNKHVRYSFSKNNNSNVLFNSNNLINDSKKNNLKIENKELYQNLNNDNTDIKVNDNKDTLSSKLTPYLLLAALSFHGLFEGIALGLQKSFKSTFSLFIAIAGHKWAESLTLGLSFAKTNTEKPLFIKMILIFSLFTPIGIGIGMILLTLPEWIGCVFMSLSVGTFIYIGASEIIVEEFSISRHKWIKLLFMILGAMLIVGLTIWEIANE